MNSLTDPLSFSVRVYFPRVLTIFFLRLAFLLCSSSESEFSSELLCFLLFLVSLIGGWRGFLVYFSTDLSWFLLYFSFTYFSFFYWDRFLSFFLFFYYDIFLFFSLFSSESSPLKNWTNLDSDDYFFRSVFWESGFETDLEVWLASPINLMYTSY